MERDRRSAGREGPRTPRGKAEQPLDPEAQERPGEQAEAHLTLLQQQLPGLADRPWPYLPEDLYFASGCNHAGEIRGFFEGSYNVGVCVAELNEEALLELEEQARVSPRLLFVDSGAFSEVELRDGRFEIARPIDHGEWERRLSLYLRLGRAWRGSMLAVAPDCVAHQRETLERLERYGAQLRELAALGVHLVVPVQRGSMHALEFWRESVALVDLPPSSRDLPDGGLFAGVTGKKDAATPEELALFAMGMVGDAAQTEGPRFFAERPPMGFHILGCGPRSKRYPELLLAILRACPWAEVSSDSCRIKALTGRSGRAQPRAFTAARDEVLTTNPGVRTTEAKAEALDLALSRERTRRFRAAVEAGWDPSSRTGG